MLHPSELPGLQLSGTGTGRGPAGVQAHPHPQWDPEHQGKQDGCAEPSGALAGESRTTPRLLLPYSAGSSTAPAWPQDPMSGTTTYHRVSALSTRTTAHHTQCGMTQAIRRGRHIQHQVGIVFIPNSQVQACPDGTAGSQPGVCTAPALRTIFGSHGRSNNLGLRTALPRHGTNGQCPVWERLTGGNPELMPGGPCCPVSQRCDPTGVWALASILAM